MALPVWNQYGKERGVLLTEIRLSDEGSRLQLGDEHRLMGAEDARFAGLQSSRNGETLQADDFSQALQLARENPESGVIIRLEGDESLLNAQKLTGGRVEESEPVPPPATPEDSLPFLSENDVAGNNDSELAVHQVARERQQDLLFELITESDLLKIAAEEKQKPDLSVDIVDSEVQMAIEKAATELDGKMIRDVAHRLQQQEREWVPVQELEKSFGD